MKKHLGFMTKETVVKGSDTYVEEYEYDEMGRLSKKTIEFWNEE